MNLKREKFLTFETGGSRSLYIRRRLTILIFEHSHFLVCLSKEANQRILLSKRC